VVEEYSLVGLNPEERDRVLSALIERFKSKAAQEDYLFFVADREGYTFELDWDELSIEGKYEFVLCPDVIGMPLVRLPDFEKCAKSNTTIRTGKYIIIEANQT